MWSSFQASMCLAWQAHEKKKEKKIFFLLKVEINIGINKNKLDISATRNNVE